MMLGFAYFMLDYWLEVSLHPKGPATDQVTSKFRSNVAHQMLDQI
jgi:hypothetical protein